MATLDRRIADLEAAAPAESDLRPSIIIIRPLLRPGEVSEVRFASCQDDRWIRTEHETEDGFLDRVCADVRSEANGKPRRVVAMVHAFDDKLPEV